jgi:adenine-specific DNA methylase
VFPLRAREIVINDVKYSTFLLLLQYIYCDQVDIAVETAMDLFQVVARCVAICSNA